MKLISNYGKPLVLDSGVQLAAAGTPGSTRDVDSISDRDRKRHVDTGRIAIVEDPAPVRAKKTDSKEEVK